MATEIGVRELKNNATRIVRAVREEHAEYIVTVRGQPAAILRPITPEDEAQERQARIEAFMAGLDELTQELSKFTRSKSALDQLLEDRRAE